MERTNIEKITDEILAGLSEDSDDSEGFDIESDNDDAEDRSWRSSHVVFGKYFHDVSIVRISSENIVPLPEKDEVVVFRSFMKAKLQFPLHKFLVEVLKKFEIFLHRLTPDTLIKVEIFIWAIRSHEL
jgi:hypothetical protein